ncbi:MAG: hypothetical protein IKO47_12240 [Ruminococcus sp.]|nr:hypothetical protein [Ruminococcus sp.]
MRARLLLIAAAAAIACTACGKSSKSSENDIKGMWSVSDDSFDGGYIFGEDGRAGVYLYPKDMYFSDGCLFISGTLFSENDLVYDGDILRAVVLGNDALILDRTGEPDTSSYDGEYLLTGGSMRDSIASGMGAASPENAEILFNVEDERIRVTAANTIDYSFDGEKLDLKGRNGFPDSSGEAELSDGVLSVKRADGGVRVLKKVG